MDDNDDFQNCEGCGGNFYYGDLHNGLCEDCEAALEGDV